MPEGGDAYPDQERVDDERIAELLEGFLGSAQALDLPRSSEVREAAELLLEYAADESGDPLRWSAVTVEVCLTQGVAWSPELTDDVAAVIPAVLRALIRWAHRELRVSPVATTEAVTSVDRWLPAFQRVRSLPSVRDYAEHSAVLRAAEGGDWGPWQRKAIEEAVGANAYDGFDSAPLPADEPLELSEVAPDIRAAVTEVGEWLDRFAESELGSGCGPEFRTACRRFLVGAATRDPEVFRRRARADLSALAVVWSVGRANQLIGYSPAPVRTGDVSAWFGARGVPSGRADTLIAAFTGGQRRWSGSVDLGDERVLVAERRRELVEMRESLAGETR
jgi:hypothetical protein